MRAYLSSLAAGLICTLVIALGACATGPLEAQNGSGPTPAHLPETAYRLGAADKLRVTTFGEPTLTGEFTVGGNGVVSLPLVGDIPAQGITVAEFRDRFVDALKDGYIADPRVSVEVLTYRPYYVLGEVTRPGEYPYTNDLTVLNAVATAGGYTYRANTQRVYIKHQNETSERAYPLTVRTAVAPGDTIRIGERFF